jgi:hypothetical protein
MKIIEQNYEIAVRDFFNNLRKTTPGIRGTFLTGTTDLRSALRGSFGAEQTRNFG